MNSFIRFLTTTLGRVIMTLVFAVVIFLLILLAINTEIDAVMYVVAAVCAFFGWRFLNRLTANLFLWMNTTGWIIYFLVKGILSIVIGMFVAPFQIAKMISYAVSQSLSEV